jgi:predicted DNA-binding ribbon-helix-helix protein
MGLTYKSTLVNHNITNPDGSRTSVRLEPEFWNALDEICLRQRRTRSQVAADAQLAFKDHPRTSAMRTYLFVFFHALVKDW